jgi:hypothetical protein
MRMHPAPPPPNFITIADAVVLVASKVSNGDRDRAMTMIAEGCEAGRIQAVYKTITGIDDLERSVWHALHWRSYFDLGTIDLDLPNLHPDAQGRTVRCTREIFIRKDSLEKSFAGLGPETMQTERGKYLTKNTVTEFVRSYVEQTSNPTKTGLREFVAAAGYVGGRNIYEPEYARQMLKRGTPIKRGRPEV